MTDRALTEAIEQVLDANPDGLTEREIRRAVLVQSGLRRRPVEIRQALQRNPRRFVSLAGGRWRLKAIVEAEDVASGVQEVPRERGEVVVPHLTNLPPLDSFIAFDLETSGLKPQRDHIIQIAAVRIVNGVPSPAYAEDGAELPAVFNEYVNLESRELPYSLKVKLGLTEHPSWEAALAHADPLDDVLQRFRVWVDDWPLVAHNARFDYAFLERASREQDWGIDNPLVDTLELACLACPDRNTFRLEELGKALDVGEGLEGGIQVEQWAADQGVADFSWSGFHNAAVDVLVLAAIVPRLLAAIRRRLEEQSGLSTEISRLLPRLAECLGIRTGPSTAARDETVRKLVAIAPVLENRLSAIDFAFTPETVHEQFGGMVERRGLKRREAQLQMVEAVSRGLRDDRFMAI